MLVGQGLVLATLAVIEGVVISARTPFWIKAVLAAVIGVVLGTFISYATWQYFEINSWSLFPAFAAVIGIISFLGILLGCWLVSLKRK